MTKLSIISLTLAIILLVSIPSLKALSNPVSLANRPLSDRWTDGAGCVLKNDNIAIILLLPKNEAANRNDSLQSTIWNANGTLRAQTYNDIDIGSDISDVNNVAIVCLSSGGYAVTHQYSTKVYVSFFNNMGQLTNQIERVNYYSDSRLVATSEGGFFITSLKNSDLNTVEVYRPNGTLRCTITVANSTVDTKTLGSRGSDGTIIIVAVTSDQYFLRFFTLDGQQTGNQIEVSYSGTAKSLLTSTLVNGNLAIIDYNDNYNTPTTTIPKLYTNQLIEVATLTTLANVNFNKYSLIALQDGSFTLGYQDVVTKEGFFKIYSSTGSLVYTSPSIAEKQGPYMLAYNDGSFISVIYNETDTEQFLYGYRIDPLGNQINFGDTCTNCPTPAEKSYFVATIRYNIPFNDFVSSNGESLFINQLMSILGVNVNQIVIISITSGSTIVNFKIIEDTTTSGSGAASITELKTNLQTAVDGSQLNVLGSSVSSFSADPVVTKGGEILNSSMILIIMLVLTLLI